MKKGILILLFTGMVKVAVTQAIPIDTTKWDIDAKAYVIENYKGKKSIYLQGGSITLKDVQFLNGTIEYDIFLKEVREFPGVYFRSQENGDGEQFYIRPHQSGNPDANQVAPTTKNITPWQLYHGPKYSFPYEYKKDDWTHVKIQVKGDQAQVFLDWSDTPQLSWNTFHEVRQGKVSITGGNSTGLHIADIRISSETPEIVDFSPAKGEEVSGLIQTWNISDKFNETVVSQGADLDVATRERKWIGDIALEEGIAANISRIHDRFDGSGENTVLAKVTINSKEDQLKLFEFGYSDRVVAFLNGKPIYRGTNRFRSRDYRYLGTIGLFDAIYLDLKKGNNELILAVSEDFGGWLVTGRLKDMEGLSIK